jgi:general secretion pathway protein N
MNYATRRILAAWPWLTVTIVSVAVTLLVMLPAAWIVPRFSKATGGHVNLVDPAGSLWKGSATLMLAAGADGEGATLLPGRIEWNTAFWALFTGHVRMQMRQTCTARRLRRVRSRFRHRCWRAWARHSTPWTSMAT